MYCNLHLLYQLNTQDFIRDKIYIYNFSKITDVIKSFKLGMLQ